MGYLIHASKALDFVDFGEKLRILLSKDLSRLIVDCYIRQKVHIEFY